MKLNIWDTALQERFRNVISTYLHGAHVALLVYDITNRASFKLLESFMKDTNDKKDMCKLLIGNKCHLEEEREVNYEEGKLFAEHNGMQFIETSAKTNINIKEAFELITKEMISHNQK